MLVEEPRRTGIACAFIPIHSHLLRPFSLYGALNGQMRANQAAALQTSRPRKTNLRRTFRAAIHVTNVLHCSGESVNISGGFHLMPHNVLET